MAEKHHLSFSLIFCARLTRNPCNAVSVHDKDKGTPPPQAEPSAQVLTQMLEKSRTPPSHLA